MELAPRLTEEQLNRLLEHDKWKVEAQHAHEVRLEEMRLASRRRGSSASHGPSSTASSGSSTISEEELKFNELSSYGACTPSHIGLISKTKIWEGASARTNQILEKWYSYIQDNNQLPLKDLKEGRIKSLLLSFLWANGCSQRAARWPEASDSGVIDAVKKRLSTKFSTFSKHSIVAAYESLKEFWKEINDYEPCNFNSTLLAHVLDEAYEYVGRKNAEETKLDVKNSPLFSEFEKSFPHVPLTSLEKYYVKNRYNFIAAGVGALRKAFTTTRPAELEHKFTEADWPKKWHQYIVSFEPKWQKELNEIYNRTKEAQEKWKGE